MVHIFRQILPLKWTSATNQGFVVLYLLLFLLEKWLLKVISTSFPLPPGKNWNTPVGLLPRPILILYHSSSLFRSGGLDLNKETYRWAFLNHRDFHCSDEFYHMHKICNCCWVFFKCIYKSLTNSIFFNNYWTQVFST